MRGLFKPKPVDREKWDSKENQHELQAAAARESRFVDPRDTKLTPELQKVIDDVSKALTEKAKTASSSVSSTPVKPSSK